MPLPIRYRIAPLDVHAHLIDVSCTVEVPDAAGQCFTLPAWTPGSYLIREFARHVVRIGARNAQGAVPLEKVGKARWRAAPCEGPLEVVAEIYAYDVSVRTAYADATRVYFNGTSTFLRPEGHEQAPCVLDIDASFAASIEGARVATAMRRDGAAPWGFGRYAADSYEELVDHPVEIGRFDLTSFEAGGVTHDVAIAGARNVDLDRVARDLARVCQWHCDLFAGAPNGRAPFDRYLFLVLAVGDGYGGLEHRASTSLVCKRDELPRIGDPGLDDGYLTFLGLASHEYFHAWNVKRIKPSAFTPYDLSQEGFTRLLWAFEGITSYYDDLSLARSGVVPAERVLELLARTLTTVLRTPGRHLQSVADASFDAWIKFYRPDENSPNAGVSYYAKGAIVALALDLTLRRHGRSLDDLMRALWTRHGATGVGVDEDAIEALASSLAGHDLRDFFARYVEGTEDPPLAALLADVGVELALRPREGMRDRGGKPATTAPAATTLGAQWPASGELRLTSVYREGPAARAGLSAHDVVVAIDGIRATSDLLAAALVRATPGSRMIVDAFRRDVLMRFDVELAAAPADTAVMTMLGEPGEAIAARRRAWLGA
ncbi:MAG TPA: PDZ domain-containing protein [Casimicrobiaceae bacterium]|nr:PDZ domain-containing protein [Casimicrobiaceae bacterium]